MADKATGTEDTVAAPPNLAQGTTRRSDPVVPQPTSPRPAGTVTRASSPSLDGRQDSSNDVGDFEELQEIDPANYTIVAEIARGGMGRILEVRDRRLGRSVAIKEVLHADDVTLARFEREVRITARLQHPAIVHVHEAGKWPNGKPFYVMKLIRGKPLDVRIGKAHTLTERLAILPAVTTVVDALAYAHSQRVIHRDLKPANVLVGDFGETIVIDWGIAKELGEAAEIMSIPIEKGPIEKGPIEKGPIEKGPAEKGPAEKGPAEKGSIEEPTEASTETVAGSVIGTPSYMPPEQASGERVDARADVYSLGALLYQLLAGVPPFVGRSTAEVLSKVIDSDPEPLAKINDDIPADLIAIVEKAMAKEPGDRFPTANEMAIELKRFQQGKLVESHRYTAWELAGRWLRRYRVAVAVAAIMLVLAGVLAVFGVARIMRERDRADQEARAATLAADEGIIKFAHDELDRDPREALMRLAQLSSGSVQWTTARMIASDAAARGISEVLADEDGAGIYLMVFSPDGSKLATHGRTGTPVVWDLGTRTKQTLYPASQMFSIAWASTNDTLVGVDFQNTEWRWKLGTPQAIKGRSFGGQRVSRGTLSPDATKYVFIEQDDCSLADLATGNVQKLGNFYEAGWTIDGRALLLFDARNHSVDRMDMATGDISHLKIESGRTIRHLAGDATHTWLAHYEPTRAGGYGVVSDGPLSATIADKEIIVDMKPTSGGGIVVSSEAPSSDGSDELDKEIKGTLVSVVPEALHLDPHSVRVLDSVRANPIVLRGHHSRVDALAISSTGLLATADDAGAIRLWHLPQLGHIAHPNSAVNRALLSPDKRELVMARRGPTFEALDLSTGKIRMLDVDNRPAPAGLEGLRITYSGDYRIREALPGPTDEVITLVRPRTGTRFATVDQAHHAIVWDLAGGKGHIQGDGALRIAISPDGKQLATAGDKGNQLWDLDANKLLAEHPDDAVPTAIALGSDGRMVLGYGDGGTIQVDPHLAPVELSRASRRMLALALSPDNTTAVGGGDDAIVYVWDLEHRSVRNFRGHTGSIITIAFSPDGTHVATSAADKVVRIWSLADGSSVQCTGHDAIAPIIEFEDADTLVSSSLDRTARVCDVHSGHSRALVGATTPVVFASHVTPSRIILVDRFGQILEHADNLPHGEALLRSWLASASSVLK